MQDPLDDTLKGMKGSDPLDKMLSGMKPSGEPTGYYDSIKGKQVEYPVYSNNSRRFPAKPTKEDYQILSNYQKQTADTPEERHQRAGQSGQGLDELGGASAAGMFGRAATTAGTAGIKAGLKVAGGQVVSAAKGAVLGYGVERAANKVLPKNVSIGLGLAAGIFGGLSAAKLEGYVAQFFRSEEAESLTFGNFPGKFIKWMKNRGVEPNRIGDPSRRAIPLPAKVEPPAAPVAERKAIPLPPRNIPPEPQLRPGLPLPPRNIPPEEVNPLGDPRRKPIPLPSRNNPTEPTTGIGDPRRKAIPLPGRVEPVAEEGTLSEPEFKGSPKSDLPKTETPGKGFNEAGDRKSPELRGQEKKMANIEAKAERFYKVLKANRGEVLAKITSGELKTPNDIGKFLIQKGATSYRDLPPDESWPEIIRRLNQE